MLVKIRYVLMIIACLLVLAPAAWADIPGELYIEAAAGISIFIDNELQGVTNMEDKGLKLILLEGSYTLRAELGGKVIFLHTFYLDSGGSARIQINP